MASKRMIGALLLCAAPLLSAPVRAIEVSPVTPTTALPPLSAYQAVYELSLVHTKGAGAPTSGRGRIAFELSGSDCEGYIENIHQITELRSSEGPPRLSVLRTAIFEAGDGKNLRFDIESKTSGEPAEKVRGEATKSSDAPLLVKLVKPEPRQAKLAADALFPYEHLRRILATAQAGGNLLQASVYDGSDDGVKILQTTTTIGKPASTAAVGKAAQVDALKNARRWPVSIAYFEADTQEDQTPLYVLSFELYENGVSGALKLDYGEFALAGEIAELAFTPTSSTCKN